MTTKPIVYLLVIGSILTMGANLAHGEEIFVLCNRLEVFIFSTLPDGSSIRKELMNDAIRFNINRNGYFTVGVGSYANLTWYKGRIDSSFNITKQTLPSIPPDADFVAISEDGKRVAWKTGESYRKSVLTIEEYNGSEYKVLRKISVDGRIPTAFSFSPNSDLLAYFWGPPESHTQDGFSLMLLDMKSPEKPPVEIAPPSLPMRLNPSRSVSPLWSPTGDFILFEAQYKDSFSRGLYIVSTDGRFLEPSPGEMWGLDGNYLIGFKQIKDDGLGEYIITETDILTHKEKEHPAGKFKISDVGNMSLSPSGRKFVYAINKEIFVYDTMKKNATSHGTVDPKIGGSDGFGLTVFQFFGKFFWISPKD